MRTEVTELVSLGRLPEDATASLPEVQSFEVALEKIEAPVSNEEALALLCVLPVSQASCFGLAWSIVHLVETAPGWPLPQAKLQTANPWVKSMLERAR